MLDKEEIKALMKDLESDRVERTTSFREDKLGPATCAFSNDFPNHQKPGYILLGVHDDGTVAGMTIGDADLQKIGNVKSNGNVLPQPSLVVSPVYKIDGGDVVAVEVQPLPYPPVRFNGRCWIRVGPRKVTAGEFEEKMLTERRTSHIKTFDLAPCMEATLADLHLEYFKLVYLPKAIDPEILEKNGREVEDQLASLRFYDLRRKRPTNAGILTVGNNPSSFFPGDYIQYVKINGTELSAEVAFEKQFSGPLIVALKNIDDFIQSNIVKEKPVRKQSFQEDKSFNYPYWALRELTMNAVMHRNFDSNAPILLYEFADRIEIVNPGGLYGDVNVHNFPNASDYRNVVIAEAMKNLGYVNRFNFGIKNARERLLQNGNGEPVFDLTLVTKFKVTIPINIGW